jgi:hypothetical protein
METGSTQVFEIARAGESGWLPLLLLAPTLILIAVTVLFWPRALRVEVGPESLTLSGSVYGRRVPRSDLLVDRLRVVDLASEPGLSFRFRTNGIGLPSYSVGWFKLKNGERSLAFVTDRRKVIYLPTRHGYVLLLSVKDPEGFARSLGVRAAEPEPATRSG